MGLVARVARVIIRIAGWLVTPVAALLAAAIGATIAAMAAPAVSSMTGLWIMVAGGLVGSIIGLALWLRMLRGSPQLRDALAVTEGGVPTSEGIDELMTGEASSSSDVPK